MAEVSGGESRQDAAAPVDSQTITTSQPPVTAIVTDLYQVLRQLSPEDLEQLLNRLTELPRQIQLATPEPSEPAVTGTGNLISGSATLRGTGTVSTAGNTITEALPQPQAKQPMEPMQVLKAMHYVIAILKHLTEMGAQFGEPIQNITAAIMERARELTDW